MDQTPQKPLPESTALDHVHLVVKAALSAIPIAGGPAAELFAGIIAPPLARRRDNWLQSLAESLASLQERVSGFRAETLSEREDFISAALQASQAAVRTHQQAKLDALRNAVLNVAIQRAPDEDQQAVFMNYIETLTAWHLGILKFFEAPLRLAAAHGARTSYSIAGALSHVLEDCFPQLRGRRDFYDQIVRDLNARGFLNSGDHVLHTMMSAGGLEAKRTTELADQFLAFINPPAEIAGD
jgi:hypothetical protein